MSSTQGLLSTIQQEWICSATINISLRWSFSAFLIDIWEAVIQCFQEMLSYILDDKSMHIVYPSKLLLYIEHIAFFQSIIFIQFKYKPAGMHKISFVDNKIRI